MSPLVPGDGDPGVVTPGGESATATSGTRRFTLAQSEDSVPASFADFTFTGPNVGFDWYIETLSVLVGSPLTNIIARLFFARDTTGDATLFTSVGSNVVLGLGNQIAIDRSYPRPFKWTSGNVVRIRIGGSGALTGNAADVSMQVAEYPAV